MSIAPPGAPFRILLQYIPWTIVLFASSAVVISTMYIHWDRTEPVIPAKETMTTCVDSTLKIIPEPPSIDAIQRVAGTCYAKLYDQGRLNDFEIRRIKITQQHYAEIVCIWLVVVITVSGVALSAIQLAASYRLAQAGQGELAKSGELSIEHGRLSLKSSVTGLFILITSFAFFWIYVMHIYKMDTINPDPPEPQSEVQGRQMAPVSTDRRVAPSSSISR